MANDFDIEVKTNALQVLDDIEERLIWARKYTIPEYVRTIAEVFVEQAQQRLEDSGYQNTSRLAQNIILEETEGGNYRIGLKDNEEKSVMFYLEFGTGFVGEKNPHKKASEVGWDYAVNRDATFPNGMPMYFDLTKPVGQQGLYSIDAPTPDPSKGEKGWIYRDKQTGTLVATSGLKAVSYIYDTLMDLPRIKRIARRRLGDEQSILRRRIVRK